MATFIDDGKVITLRYDLREGGPGGELLERMDVNYPFTFLFGNGNLLPAFEEQLRGLPDRASFQFTLPIEQAYGPHRADQVLRLQRTLFVDRTGSVPPGMLLPGNQVRLTANNGQDHSGKVVRVDGDEVLVDFNHAMAGKPLYFEGAVLHVRAATADELARRHHLEESGVRR